MYLNFDREREREERDGADAAESCLDCEIVNYVFEFDGDSY